MQKNITIKNKLTFDITRIISAFIIIFLSATYIILFALFLEDDNRMAGIIKNPVDIEIEQIGSDLPDTATTIANESMEGENEYTSPAGEPSTLPAVVEPQSNTEDTKENSETVLSFTEDAGDEYIDKIIFLGDSTTYGLLYYEVLSGGNKSTQVWTPKARTFTLSRVNYDKILYPDDGGEYLVKDAVKLKMPEILVITLGVNGVSFMDEDDFRNSYGKLIDDIKKESPNTKIVLQSIFPIASHYDKQIQINNEKICTSNGWILKIAEEKGVKYLDTYTALLGEDGYLPEKYQNGDGMHLNKEGFEVVLNFIKTHKCE